MFATLPYYVGKFPYGYDLDPFRQNQNILWIMLIKVYQLKLEFKLDFIIWTKMLGPKQDS